MSDLANTDAPPGAAPGRPRLRGLDVARALAIAGMVVVNYELAMGASERGPAWLAALTGSLQGRAAGTFVVLAGIGASLGSERARRSADPDARRRARWTLLRRALFLLVVGTLFLTVWPADILHFYAAYLAVGAVLLFARDAALLACAAAATVGSALFLVFGDWAARWDFTTLSYRGLWTWDGYLRNLVVDGWHPVLPWVALYLVGMLVGRLDLAVPRVRVRLVAFASVAVLAAESFAPLLGRAGIGELGLGALARTTSFPPTPAYVVAAAATALLVIVVSCELAERLPRRLVAPIEATGRLALTLYVAHVLVGLGTIEALGGLEGRSLPFAVGAAAAFTGAGILFAWAWTKRWRRGPLEGALRWFAG